jgi:hypothetical protein
MNYWLLKKDSALWSETVNYNASDRNTKSRIQTRYQNDWKLKHFNFNVLVMAEDPTLTVPLHAVTTTNATFNAQYSWLRNARFQITKLINHTSTMAKMRYNTTVCFWAKMFSISKH